MAWYYIIWVLERVAVFTALSFVAFFMVRNLFAVKENILLFAPALGFIFTVFTLYALQGHSVLFDGEASVLASLNKLKKDLNIGRAPTNFVKNNFILINTSLNPELTNSNDASYEDSAKNVITNRKMLTSVLEFAAEEKGLDLVVCDLIFSSHTANDEQLLLALVALQSQNKLVIAYNKDFTSKNSAFYKKIKRSSFGDVTKVSNEAFYFSHDLFNKENMPSLPYAMHLKLTKEKMIEKSYLHKNFITEFNFTDEKELYNLTPEYTSTTGLYTGGPKNVFNLGQVATEDGRLEISDAIALKKKGEQKILFIGNFRDEYIDRHATAYGNLSGVTILINEFYYIHAGYYKMSWLKGSIYFLTLLILYTTLCWSILYRKITKQKEKINSTAKSKGNFLSNWFNDMIKFVFEESHYFLLFGIAFLVDVFFHKLINIMGILYVLIPLAAILQFFAKNLQEKVKLKK